MTAREEPARWALGIQPVETIGSHVVVGSRDKAERIREAMIDLRLAIDGCIGHALNQPGEAYASLARHCSIFLRKMVLGDERSPRLLDEETPQTMRVGFDRIRKISSDRRTLTLVPVDFLGGGMQVTKLNDETEEPEGSFVMPIGPQRLSIEVEWPLPGMADWNNQPTEEEPWKIRPEGLFESSSRRRLTCDPWLGQQLVIFDGRGITLKDVIRVTANTEGAHSPPLERLWIHKEAEDRARFRVVKDRAVHVLSHITVGGVRYNHAVVVATALYLYGELVRAEAVKLNGAEGVPVVALSPPDVFSPRQGWLQFDGGLAFTLGGVGQAVHRRVRAPR